MADKKLTEVAESGDGRLFEVEGFQIPVLKGSHREMGAQYGALMKDAMEQAFDVILKPGSTPARSATTTPRHGRSER